MINLAPDQKNQDTHVIETIGELKFTVRPGHALC